MVGDQPGAPDPFAPAQLGPLRLRNRMLKAATFEGMAVDNLVSDRWSTSTGPSAGRRGGPDHASRTCAVSPDGQGAPNEIVLRPSGACPACAGLAEAVHAEGAAVAAQIGHAGPVAQRRITGTRPLAPRRVQPDGPRFTEAVGEADIERVTGDFAAAARVVADAGLRRGRAAHRATTTC